MRAIDPAVPFSPRGPLLPCTHPRRASSGKHLLNPGTGSASLPLSESLLIKGCTITLQSRLVLELYCAKPGVAGMPTRWAAAARHACGAGAAGASRGCAVSTAAAVL